MTDLRRDKVAGFAIPDQQVDLGDPSGKLVVVGWGSTFGPIHQAVRRARTRGLDVSHIHLRHIWPMPKNLEGLLKGFERVLVRSEEHTSELQSLMRISYAVFCLKKKKKLTQSIKCKRHNQIKELQ